MLAPPSIGKRAVHTGINISPPEALDTVLCSSSVFRYQHHCQFLRKSTVKGTISTEDHVYCVPSCKGVAVIENLVYAVGGSNRDDGTRSNLNSMERYSPEKDEWEDMPSMHRSRGAASVTALNGCLYAVGGYDSGKYSVLSLGAVLTDALIGVLMWCPVPNWCPNRTSGVSVVS